MKFAMSPIENPAKERVSTGVRYSSCCVLNYLTEVAARDATCQCVLILGVRRILSLPTYSRRKTAVGGIG